MFEDTTPTRWPRRDLLAVLLSVSIPGCTNGAEAEDPLVRFYNGDSERHSLQARFRGAENDETVQEFSVTIEAEGEQGADERLQLDRYEGSELIVTTQIDDGDRMKHFVSLGFTHLGVAIEADESINFSTGTA